MTIRDVVLTVRQRWWVLALCVLLGGGIGAGIALIGPAQYSSTTRVVVAVPDIDQGSLQPPGGLSVTQRATNYANLATSASVLSGVIDELGLHATVKDLMRQVDVDMPTGTTVVQITATDGAAAGAQHIAQAVAEHLAATAGTLEQAIGVTDPQVVISVADPAPLPSQPDARGTALKGALGVIVGLIFGAGILWVVEYLDSSIRNPEELAAETGAAVLATIPSRATSSLPMSGDGADAIRTARTALAALAAAESETRPGRSIFVIAAVTADARCTAAAARTAVQLAVTEGRAGNRTLLIDADLVHASVGTALGLPRGNGLSGRLSASRQDAPDPARWAPGGIDVLTAGAAPEATVDALRPAALATVLESVGSGYDVIIISGPPALASVDSATLAAAATATAVVARWGATDLAQARHAKDRVTMSGGQFAGTIVDGVPTYRRSGDPDFVPAPL